MGIKNYTPKRRISTIDWLSYHYDRNTKKPFLENIHQSVAQKFSILCEKMISNYRVSRWHEHTDNGHIKKEMPLQINARKALYDAIKTLDNDIGFVVDIVIRDYSLRKVEKKYKLHRGKAKIKLRHLLDKLAVTFGIKTHHHDNE